MAGDADSVEFEFDQAWESEEVLEEIREVNVRKRARASRTVRWRGKAWSGLEDKQVEHFNCLLKPGMLTLLTTLPQASLSSLSTKHPRDGLCACT